MAYLLNTLLKDNQQCTYSLAQCFGLGIPLARQVCDLLGCSRQIKLNQLTSSQKTRLVECISQNYKITTQLRGDLKRNKGRLVAISCSRGIRLTRGLPCRGQRTHGNARTCRKINRNT